MRGMGWAAPFAAASVMVLAGPASATASKLTFDGFSVAPGSALAIGASYDFGDYRFSAISDVYVGTAMACTGSDCLNIGAADYLGVGNPTGNFLFAKAGYDLMIQNLTGKPITIIDGVVGSLNGPLGWFEAAYGVVAGSPGFSQICCTNYDSATGHFHIDPFAQGGTEGDVTLIGRDFVVGAGGSRTTYFDNLIFDSAEGPVPEPAVWILAIMGFGLTGAALRRRRAASVVEGV